MFTTSVSCHKKAVTYLLQSMKTDSVTDIKLSTIKILSIAFSEVNELGVDRKILISKFTFYGSNIKLYSFNECFVLYIKDF